MSLSFAPPLADAQLLARLHLYAVLPAFADLLKHSDVARCVLGEQRIFLRIQAGTLSADLLFSQGRCRFLRESPTTPSLVLRFLTHTQLNRQFTGKGFALPIPIKGAHRVRAMKTFAELSSLLQAALLPSSETNNPADRELHVRLTLGVGLAAAAVLIDHESFSRELLGGKDWLAQFRIRSAVDAFNAWIGHGAAIGTTWGRGNPPTAPDAILEFANPSVALKALGGRLDNMAAVNAGLISIRGNAPLVDKLGVVFDRVPVFLEP